MEFDHLGVFVKTLEEGRDMLQAILPIAAISDPIHDPLLRVFVHFLSDTSGIRYENSWHPTGQETRSMPS
jgi:hypothetical protein